MSDDIESLLSKSSELSKKADSYSAPTEEAKGSGMFSGMGAMGGSMMPPSFLSAPQKPEPEPELVSGAVADEPAYDDFSKQIQDQQKRAMDVVSKFEAPQKTASTSSEFPTIDAAKNWALESIEKGAQAISFGSEKPEPDALTSQLHQLSPSKVTPDIKAEAAKVMDPVQLKQWPAWLPKTEAQHRAEFDRKHVETSMSEKGKEAWNVGVGIGKGLLDVGARFGSGVAKAGATILKGPGAEGNFFDPKEWQRWNTGVAKLATVPAVSVAESLESVVQTASNAFQNGLSATDWVNEQLPVEQGGITREEAFQNYLGRKRADEYYAGWKVTDPNVFTRVIMEDPATRELAENMAYSMTSIWSPSVDDRLQRHNGNRDAAMREKQLDDLRDSQQLISNFRQEAAQMVPDPDLTEAAGWTRLGMNPFDVYGRIGGAGMRGISKGIKAASRVGKTAEQIAAMEAEAAAKAFEAELKAAEAAKTPGLVEGFAGKVADKVEPAAAWLSARYSDLPESVQEGLAKMGSGMIGTPLTKTAAILASAGVAAPRIAQAALAGRRLAAGGVEGGFEAGAKAATEAAAKTGLSPKAQQWLANKSIPAAKTLDWMAQNSMEMARGSVHGATLAAAVGVLENKDIEEIADMMGQGIFLHLGGEVMGNMTGVSHGRYMSNLKRQRASAAKWFNELDPATQAHVRDLGNWDSYVESLKGLRDNAENNYAQRKGEADNVAYSGESPEKIQAAQEKANDALIELNIRNAQVRNADKANSDTQKMYRDSLNIGMADVMTALNGSSRAGRNVEMKFTTAEELAREALTNNRDKGLTDLEMIELYNFVLGQSAEFAFIAENGGKHTLTSGKTVDLYTPYKDRININIDSIKARMGSGESALNAFGHEAGHAFWNVKEFREGVADTYKNLFGNQKFDERGNLIGGDPGLFSAEDLINKFKDYYARGYDLVDQGQLASMTPEQRKEEIAKQLAQKIGLWDPVMQELDLQKTAAYMRHEMMAELIQGGAQGGIKLGADPKPWLAPLVDWATTKQKNTKTGKKVRSAFGLTESAPWDSDLTGTRFSAEQVESTRNALRAVAELNGDIAAAELIPHAPITETQMRSNEAVANQFGEAFFAHEKVATVLDRDGNVVESRVITDPAAMEGTFERGVTETGDPELRQTAGYGSLPAETNNMSVPEGGRVTVTSRIKRDASGSLASLTPEQAKALNKARANIIRKAILDAPDREYPGRMDTVSADGLSLGGRLSPKQIEAIKGLPETIIPFGLKRRILEFNDLLVRDDGDSMIGLYGQAMDRQGRYKSFAPKIVDFVPLGMRLSKDGNILFNMFSKTGMREKLRRWQRDTPELLTLWNGDGESFMGDVRKVLENWKPREGAPAGLPGETGLDADLNMAISKKNRVNDFLNIFRKTEPESLTANPARTTMRRPARRLTKAEKLDEESSDPNTLIRSYRVDRFHDLEKSSDAPFRVNYGKALYNLMPAKSEIEQRPELPPVFEESILKGLRSINAFYMGSGAGRRLPLTSPVETFTTRFKPRQNEEDAMVSHGFYSKAGSVLLDKMPNRASAAQLRGILDPQKGSGVKPEELKWSGIDQFIERTAAENGFVTKEDIRRFLEEDYAAQFTTQTEFGDIGGTQYDKYALPGGENYKEVVLKMPGVNFRSSHFQDVPNYVAHLRTAEHGNGLLVEEFQSDLHKLAREKGYKEPIPVEELLPKMEEDLARLTEERTRLFEQYKRATKELRSMPGTPSELTEEQRERVRVLREFQGEYGNLNYEVNAAIDGVKEDIEAHKSGKRVQYRGKVSDAPFRKDWPLQLFKYALKDAVETGKEWVGWTGGEAQADRYSLSNQIDTLAYDTVNQKLTAVRAGQRVFDKLVPTGEVQNYVGKEVAEKLLSSEDRGNGMRMIFPEDMKIGGEGMKGFYDVMLPKELGKYVKQWGGKVEKSEISTGKKYNFELFNPEGEPQGVFVLRDILTGKFLADVEKETFASKAEDGELMSKKAAESMVEAFSKSTNAPIWKVAITPEMRESVAGGQTRFMPAKEEPLSKLEDEFRRVPSQEELDAMKAQLPKYSATTEMVKPFSDGTTLIRLFDENSEDIGYAYVRPSKDNSSLQIDSTHLEGDYRNKGYGQALYREIAKYAQQVGMESLTAISTSRLAANARSRIFETKWRGAGWDAESKVPSGIRYMPAPADPEYNHPKGLFPKTEESKPYKMSAIHKISEDGLLFADKMGGLAVPSIAVVKAGTGIQGFGNITLVGGRNLADPRENPVFTGDAYTQRFPRPEYPSVKAKVAQSVINEFKPAQAKYSSGYGDNVTDIIWDNAVNKPSPEESVNKMKRSNVAKAAFLGGAAPEPVMRAVKQDLGILDTVAIKEWMSKNSLEDVDYDNNEIRKSLGEAILSGFEEILPPELAGKVRRMSKNLVDENGLATVSAINRLEFDNRNYGKTEIDSAATQSALDAALTGKESEFYQWIEDKIEGMYAAPRIRVDRKWEPYTLENIAKVMTSGKVAGVEKSMTQSTGLTAAEMARQLGSLEEMRNVAQAPWGIQPEKDVNEERARVSELLRNYRSTVADYYSGSTWDAMDDSMKALSTYKRVGGGESGMRKVLSKAGFKNLPDSAVTEAYEAYKALSSSPVKYFESKPQRIVKLNEFQGAIVPENVSPAVLNVLMENGIETRIIPSEKADDSAFIGSEIDKLKGGVALQEQAGIRFSPAKLESEYKAAFEAKDEERARGLVDEAAKTAGYKYRMYRGVENDYLKGDAYVFNKADETYFTSDKEKAERYAFGWRSSSSPDSGAVYDVYLKMENPWIPDRITDAQGWEYYDKKLREQGYDGVIGAFGGKAAAERGDIEVAVVFDPSQIKSADPFTYDNAGNLIPLSERFNPGTGDIRFMPAKKGAPGALEGIQMEPKEEKERISSPFAVQMSKPATEYDHLRVGTALLGTEARPLDTPQTSNIMGSIVPDKLLASQLEKMNYPHMPDSILNETNPKIKRDKMVEFMKQNLKALYDAFPEEYRARSTQWYDGARKLADELSAQYADITPEQAAGILAVFSPQKDWFMNVAQGYQCADIYKNEQGTVITPELAKKEIEEIINAAQAPVKQKLKAPKNKKETPRQKTIRQNKNKAMDQKAKDDRREVLERLYGKSLSELPDGTKEGNVLEAWGIRVLAQIKFGRRYRNISPEGELLGNAKNKKGSAELTNTWGSTGEIRKAVSIMKDGTLRNISDNLGDEHKVRNFYNNIVAPNTPFGDATIDTHAVAAAHLMPYGSSAEAVKHNFGGAGKSAPIGVSGSYHVYMDAYQQLAKELGILPRQLQSITWEAIRELYPSEERSPKSVNEAVKIWKQNNENDARRYILRNGISAPVWARAAND
jgi:GNAT superfamily N-acetyltransferase